MGQEESHDDARKIAVQPGHLDLAAESFRFELEKGRKQRFHLESCDSGSGAWSVNVTSVFHSEAQTGAALLYRTIFASRGSGFCFIVCQRCHSYFSCPVEQQAWPRNFIIQQARGPYQEASSTTLQTPVLLLQLLIVIVHDLQEMQHVLHPGRT